jgi:hypothetical protein
MHTLESTQIINSALISKRIMLMPYLVVPLVIVLILTDYLFFSKRLQTLLLVQPALVLFAGILFGLPHIVASLFAYADKNYRTFYKNDFKFVLPASLIVAIITVYVLPEIAAYVLYTVLTLVHTIGQQAGLSRSGIRISDRTFLVWRWSSTLVACCTVLSLVQTTGWKMPLLVAAVLALSVSSYCAIRLIAEAGGAKKAVYLVATQAMLLTAFTCFVTGYALLGVLIPRIVHDCTALILYTCHDRTHTLNSKNNVIYAKLNIKGKHVFWFLPLISVILAAFLNMTGLLLITITYFHYFIERTAWSRQSIHRSIVKFG